MGNFHHHQRRGFNEQQINQMWPNAGIYTDLNNRQIDTSVSSGNQIIGFTYFHPIQDFFLPCV